MVAKERVVREYGAHRRLLVYSSPWRVGLMLLGSAVFVAAGLFLLGLDSLRARIIGVVGIVFFGLVGIALAVSLLRRKPMLILDHQGIHDHASALAAGFISWGEITNISQRQYRTSTQLAIEVTDSQAVLARVNPVRRGLMWVNLKSSGAVAHIPLTALPIGVEELVEEIRSFMTESGSV